MHFLTLGSFPFTVQYTKRSKVIKVFDFCEFSCTRGHENWRKLKHLIYVKFGVPGVMKIGENLSI